MQEMQTCFKVIYKWAALIETVLRNLQNKI
jgi:hypothetical protein